MRYTKRSRRSMPLSVETLEGLTLLSGVAAIHHSVAHPVPPIQAAATTALTGSFGGPYSIVTLPYYGNIESFAMPGTLGSQGSAHIAGYLHVSGNTPDNASGYIVETNHGGTMVITISSTSASAGSATNVYYYTVNAATGNDRGYRGTTGTVSITLGAVTGSGFSYHHGQGTVAF